MGDAFDAFRAAEREKMKRMMAKRPPPAPAQVQSVREEVREPKTPLKRVSWTLTGRLEHGVDLSKQLANIHEALPLLAAPVEGGGGCPAIMWMRVDEETFDMFENLDEEHTDADVIDTVEDSTGNFVLKGISPTLKVSISLCFVPQVTA